ncbi:MAG: isopentenyl phosphate kinase family protein [Ardenticatenaceae bacterium]|nr:isopentenyl phosphate kinase family protein [Ardenticatenaceae bacterium]
MLFLKLGGSLITDKTGVEAVRADVLARAAAEIAAARAARPFVRLVVGHGGGSFGHVAAAQVGTRQGVATADQWRGFAEVHAAMARLNRLVVEALLAAGVPALGLAPSALALCENGRITHIHTATVQAALDAGLVPVIFGDVAFDAAQGGTIISTEEVMMALADELRPSWLLLAGEVPGVLDAQGGVVATITRQNYDDVAAALGGSRGTDVTGGMVSKVQSMLRLVDEHPQLSIRIFSGLEVGLLAALLREPETAVGTRIA